MSKGGGDKSAVEAELTELSRKYRIMEGDRRSYTEEASSTIKKQKVAIDKLKSENEHLREELSHFSKPLSHKESVAVSSRVSSLQDQIESLTRKLESERRRVDELDRQSKLFAGKYKEKKESTGGESAIKETAAAVDKQVRILENRLDKALVKFNEALAVNRTLREDIDNLRQERVVFDGIYKKLERELHEKKRGMAGVIEVSNLAYEERDAAQNELAAQRQLAEREMAAIDDEFRKLERTLENDRKQKEFLKAKERNRTGGAAGGSGSGADGAATGEDGNDAQSPTKASGSHSQSKAAVVASRDRALQQEASEKAAEYESAVAKIRSATGIQDMDELVDKFVVAEDRNFSLFNYVNELNNEIERLEEQITEIRGEMDRFKGAGASSDSQRKRILTDLGDRLAKTEARAQEFETRAEDAQRILNELKGGIQGVFDRAGCDAESVSADTSALSKPAASDNADDANSTHAAVTNVTESNMMLYLGVIEQRTNELLASYNGLLQRSIDQTMADDDLLQLEASADADLQNASSNGNANAASTRSLAAFPGPAAPAGSQHISIQPPSTGDEFGDDADSDGDAEDDDRPLTRDELKARSSRVISKREREKGGQPAVGSPAGQTSSKKAPNRRS
eukprot:ANDGO_01996.mRNA.1 Outer dynein arm protein 1